MIMSLSRQDIKDLISINTEMYGRGFKYKIMLRRKEEDHYFLVNSITELKGSAEEGDEIRIEVLTGHQSRYDSGHSYDVLEFVVEETKENRRRIEEYRERKSNKNLIYSSPQDTQKQSLYDWERASVDKFKTDRLDSLDEAEKFIDKIFDDLGLTSPHLKYHAGRTSSCSYYGTFHEIRIGDWGFSKPVLIHESVHGIVSQLGLSRFVASHGPLFLGIYIDLLDKYLDYCQKEELEIDASYHYDLEFIEDVNIEFWKMFKKNKRSIGIVEINRLRQTEYVSKDGVELTDNQKEVLYQVKENRNEKIDGRSVGALVRRSLLEKSDNEYKLTGKGKKALKILSQTNQ